MSKLVKTVFGGTDRSAQNEQKAQNLRAEALIEEKAAEARADVQSIFPKAQQARDVGTQNALQALAGGVGQQLGAFQQGNVGAQQQQIAGLSQIQNALFGTPVDFSQFQPTQVDFSTQFAQQPADAFAAQNAPPVQQQPQQPQFGVQQPFDPNDPRARFGQAPSIFDAFRRFQGR